MQVEVGEDGESERKCVGVERRLIPVTHKIVRKATEVAMARRSPR